MARSVQRLNVYVTNLECFTVLRCFGDALAVFASDDRSAFEFGVGQLVQ
jgi:hypothetical protein